MSIVTFAAYVIAGVRQNSTLYSTQKSLFKSVIVGRMTRVTRHPHIMFKLVPIDKLKMVGEIQILTKLEEVILYIYERHSKSHSEINQQGM